MARRSTESGRDEDEQAALRGQVDVEATLSLPRHHFPISTQHHQTTDFLHLSSRNPHRPSTHTSTLLQQTGHDRFPPSFIPSNRPLPPKPAPQPPPYLQNSTVKSIISPPPPPSEDAYTYKISLFAALDSNSDANLSSPNPAPPVRGHSSPPAIILGSNQGASAEKLDRPDDGEGEGAGSSRRAGGTARLRTLFFSGRLGGARREKEQLMGMGAGKSTFGSETERLSRFFFSLSFTVGPRSTRRAFGPILFTQPFTPPYSSPTDPLFFHTSSFFTLAFRS